MGQETSCLGARGGSLLSRRVSPKLAHTLRPRSPTHSGRQCQDFEVVWNPGMQAVLSYSREAGTVGAPFWIEVGAFRRAQAHIWSPRHPFPGPEHLSEMPESPNCRRLSYTCKGAWIQAMYTYKYRINFGMQGLTFCCRKPNPKSLNTIDSQTCRAWIWHQLASQHEVWESLSSKDAAISLLPANALEHLEAAFSPANTVLSRSS